MIHRFAVFGDIHGRVALMLVLARAWQRHHGVMLDGILQVGDMGAYPDHGRLDRATLKHAQHDADELGYVAFLTETADAERFLKDDATPMVAFCRGNHEDFDHLAELHEPTAVDPYGKLVFIPDGHVLTWPRADDAAPLPSVARRRATATTIDAPSERPTSARTSIRRRSPARSRERPRSTS